MKQQNGHFVISLDFEIMWGVRDVITVQSYGEHLRGVQQVIPKLLSIFQQFNIKATFSTVGLLFFDSKAQMMTGLPAHLPKYTDKNLSPYGDYMARQVGNDYTKDMYHFAPHLIKMIQNTSVHEIGTHTFSHYYCLEEGQTVEDFRDDINAAISIAKTKGIKITSIVFPRNQFNEDYLQVCRQSGIIAFRNNEESWLYKAKNAEGESLIRRVLRLLDAYVNLTGYHCNTQQLKTSSFPVNIPSSRFLRPYSKRIRFFEELRMRRIKKAMTHAAKNKLIYHLWWHPHNFGINQNENFNFLQQILLHYKNLNEQYGFASITMSDLAMQLLKKDEE